MSRQGQTHKGIIAPTYAALAPRLDVLLTGSSFFVFLCASYFVCARAQVFRTELLKKQMQKSK